MVEIPNHSETPNTVDTGDGVFARCLMCTKETTVPATDENKRDMRLMFCRSISFTADVGLVKSIGCGV